MKSILVTGAAGNLGNAVCQKFLDSGWNVIGTVEKGKTIRSPISGVDYREVDLLNPLETKAFFPSIKKDYDKIHAASLLVGGFAMGNIQTTTKEDLQNMIDLNFMTTYHTAQNAHLWMKDTGGGCLIFVGAKPALDGGGKEVIAYTLSKTMVIKMAEILNESGIEDNIVSSVIVPSIIDTPPNRTAMPNTNFEDWVKPAHIANNIFHLCSDSGRTLRKTVLRVYNNS